MAEAMHGESPVHRLHAFSGARVGALFDRILLDRDWLLAVAVGEEGLVGMLVLYCAPIFYSDEQEVGDLAFYVVPGKRGTRAAPRLLFFGETWASAKGAVLRLGLTTGVRVEGTRRFLEKAGYQATGILMSKYAA